MKKLLIILALFLFHNARAQKIDRMELLRDVQTLSSDEYEGRKTGTPGNKKAADYIVSRFKEIGLSSFENEYKQPFTFKNRKDENIEGTNLIAWIKGETADVIVISAHYDHIGINNGQVFNGADDNASGVAVILSMASYFKKHQPKNTLLFIAFDAEEMGLQGSKAFLKKPLPAKENIKLNINLDMVSHNDKSELYAAGTYKNPRIKEIIKGADKNTGIRIKFGHDLPGTGSDDWTMQSDHGSFAKENIPFLYFGVEDHPDYHKPTDVFTHINQDFFYASSNAILQSAILLDNKLTHLKSVN